MKKKRYYVDTEGNDDNAYVEAIAQAGALATHEPAIRKVVLLIHTKSNTAWFDRLFGREFTQQLFKGARINGVPPLLKLETLKTFDGDADVVIACALDDKDLFALDDNPFIKAIIAVPWQRELAAEWISRWSPQDVRSGQNAPGVEEPSCVVRKALESLTNSINLSTGIAHPSDEGRAKTYIRALHEYETSLDPNLIASYLVTKLNWRAGDAEDVKKLIETLNNGKYFQGGQRTGLKKYYERWREACK